MRKWLLFLFLSCLTFPLCLGQEDIQELIRKLSDKEILNRFEAVNKLKEMRKKAIPAIPALIKMLLEENYSYTRAEAARALGEIGEEASSSVPALTKALTDVYHVKIEAIIALRKIGEKSISAIPSLIEVFNSSSRQYYGLVGCEETIDTLCDMGEKAIPELASALKHKNPGVVACSLVVLENISKRINIINKPEMIQAIPSLIKIYAEQRKCVLRFRISHGDIRSNMFMYLSAARILSRMGDRPVPDLLHLFAQEGFQLSPVYPRLCEREIIAEEELSEQEKEERRGHPKIYATDILIKIGKPALPRLEEALHEKEFVQVHDDLKKLILHIKKSLYPEYLYLTWEGTEFVFRQKEIPHLLELFLEKGGDEKSLYAAALLAFARESLPYLEKALREEKYEKIHPQIRGIIKKIKAKGKRR